MFVSQVDDKKVKLFLEKLKELYAFIEDFCKEQNLECKYSDVEIYEEFAGKYKTREIYAYKSGEFVFKFKPIGAYIIAADGRVDLIGKFDEKRIIFLENPHEFKIGLKVESEGEEKNLEETGYPLYNVDKSGWYIVLEEGKTVPLTKNSLCRVLEEISGFKCS